MKSLDAALASPRSIIALNVLWSTYARQAVAILKKASTKLESYDITIIIVDEESSAVRAWLNKHTPEKLGGDVALGAGSILWLENGIVVDLEIAGGKLTLQELLVRTRDHWNGKLTP